MNCDYTDDQITNKVIWARRNTKPSGSKVPGDNVQTATNGLFGEDIWPSQGEPEKGDFTAPQPLHSGFHNFFWIVFCALCMCCRLVGTEYKDLVGNFMDFVCRLPNHLGGNLVNQQNPLEVLLSH